MKNLLLAVLLVIGVAGGGFMFLASGGPPGDEELLRLLSAHWPILVEVGDALMRSGAGAKLDLRTPSTSPPNTPEQERLARLLRSTPIELAEYDGELNGVIFEAGSVGIGISGSSSGILYTPNGRQLPPWATLVDELVSALRQEKARKGPNNEVAALFVRAVDPAWAILLETY